MKKHLYTILFFAIAALPGTILRLIGVEFAPPVMATIAGLSIMSASFLLLWACDAAQSDISQALALAVVALIAVLPEYAVDMYFTWQAGQYPESSYAHYAIANMTGANRLLIGVAWALIALIFLIRHKRSVVIDKDRRTELLFLGIATAYAFIIPIKGSLAWYDGIFFLGLYAWYLRIAGGRPCEESNAEGPAELLTQLPKVKRRLATAGLFLFSALTILANAEPFCENLVATGKVLGINEFFLVQWLAPIASEAPEFIVALSFAWQGRGGLALGSLLSSKLNQWTLLVGMIPGVFALSSRQLGYPLPMDTLQMHEIMLTAAQSLLGVVMLASLQLSWRGAILLFVLFAGQLILPPIIVAYPSISLGLKPDQIHPLFSILYLIAAGGFFLSKPKNIFELRKGIDVSLQK